MHKIIVSLLIVTNITIQGMELITDNQNILAGITKQLYITHHHKIQKFGKSISALTQINKAFYQYNTDENIAKILVKFIARHHKICDAKTAFALHPRGGIFRKIFNTIDTLFTIAMDPDKNFTEKDLQDPWYLNATMNIMHHKPSIKRNNTPTLLSVAIKKIYAGKIELLLGHGAKIENAQIHLPLLTIAKKRAATTHTEVKENLFTIAQLLLIYDTNPDERESINCPTALLFAAYHKDKDFVKLLLSYNANPYITSFSFAGKPISHNNVLEHITLQTPKDAFYFAKGQPKGWLQTMVKEVKASKK